MALGPNDWNNSISWLSETCSMGLGSWLPWAFFLAGALPLSGPPLFAEPAVFSLSGPSRACTGPAAQADTARRAASAKARVMVVARERKGEEPIKQPRVNSVLPG